MNLARIALFFSLLFYFDALAVAETPNLPKPDQSPALSIDLQWLYLRPGASNLQYATYTQPLPLPAPHWITQNVSPSFHSAFSVGMQYDFATADELQADWLHLATSDSNNMSASGSASVAPPYYFGPLAQALFRSSAVGSADFNVDNVNLGYAHQFKINQHLQFSPFIGLGLARLKQYLTANFQGYDAAVGGNHYNITSYNTSKYLGAGPRFALDTTASFLNHFGFHADFGAALMAGWMTSETTFRSQGHDNPTAVTTSLADQGVARMVPEFDSNVSLSYQMVFHSGSSLSLALGYRFNVYFNGINQVVPTSLVPNQFNQGVIAIETSGQDQSNLDFNGPYIKGVWRFQT
ncbi:MAG: hypothetical protein COV52_00925 [Gammaproteobacteria bacterium CG11_big_fil_rev_8_21_14_0_20_46_22]|nr:MAG: hypothetical protein COW05_03025 [Gammaproteobacteria bacterium CG12_big_fil_rev_8_21_14_0_65_46_12]PIR11980.1 MAG: hypothetical protein COV52_00925 [Gammaproteobacteria bacterium CG11_big_fil_rev_8_21_14_0_20_46_22]